MADEVSSFRLGHTSRGVPLLFIHFTRECVHCFSKLGLANKMALQVDSSNVFHLENTKIDETLYDDPSGSHLPI
jgi:hypothetical protein